MYFLEALHDRVLVCDGAMGTLLSAQGIFSWKALARFVPLSNIPSVPSPVTAGTC